MKSKKVQCNCMAEELDISACVVHDEHCKPLSTDPKGYFDLSDEEKKNILDKASKQSALCKEHMEYHGVCAPKSKSEDYWENYDIQNLDGSWTTVASLLKSKEQEAKAYVGEIKRRAYMMGAKETEKRLTGEFEAILKHGWDNDPRTEEDKKIGGSSAWRLGYLQALRDTQVDVNKIKDKYEIEEL